MGLRDRYQAPATPATPAADTQPAKAATPPASGLPSAPVTSPEPTPTSAPSAARRDLAALRARLAGGSNGGVNPPEAAAAVADTMLDPCTRETPDGGAEPLPNHPDAAKAGAAAESAQPAPDAASPPKRKRRTKAEMEAARAASAPSPATAPVTAAGAEPEPHASAQAEENDMRDPEFSAELAAASAETAGHIILTNDLRTSIEVEAVNYYLRNLSLEGAITLVRERMFTGMKTLTVER